MLKEPGMHGKGEGRQNPDTSCCFSGRSLASLDLPGRMKSRVRQKEQNRTKCPKAGDYEAEEGRDGKVLE